MVGSVRSVLGRVSVVRLGKTSWREWSGGKGMEGDDRWDLRRLRSHFGGLDLLDEEDNVAGSLG